MRELDIPDLTFSMIKYGKHETPWDLRPLLYLDGASTNVSEVSDQIAKGTYGVPILDRIPLVEKLHEVIAGVLAGGGSRHTTKGSIDSLRSFFSWADGESQTISLETVERVYINWTDHLLHRQRIVGDISAITIHDHCARIARILDEVLDLRVGLISKTRVRKPKRKRRVLGAQADKQNLEQTFAFGNALLDIIDALSGEAIRGTLPVKIQFRTGQVIEDWSGRRSPEQVLILNIEPTTPQSRYQRKRVEKKRAVWEADNSFRTRFPLVNLRIQAEILVFIAQTGMNLAQVHTLKMSKFRYQSHIDGYCVYRVYKRRRQGEVAFEIFSEYKAIFERYLAWRNVMFPGDDEGLLFPLIRQGGRAADVSPTFDGVIKLCKKLGVHYFPPSALRKTRINWLLRLSRDPAMTAEMHAHTQETLIQNYEQPHLQIAMIEISRFHARTDPAIAPPGPGVCIKAVPKTILGASSEAPVPDCASPAGCLFCEHQRDIDSEDHVWSLSSYRHFKSMELASYRLPTKGSAPISAVATIDRVTSKLRHFKESSEVRALWVSEALARIDEGDYHPRWDGFIQLMEAKTC